MARHSVDVQASGMMVVKKKVHTDLGGGKLGLRQVRSMRNVVRSPKLLAHNSCMASSLAGKSYGNLGDVQDAFRSATKSCAGKSG